MTKIALIGAGSRGFTKSFLTDIMSKSGLGGATVSLMDINEDNLIEKLLKH